MIRAIVALVFIPAIIPAFALADATRDSQTHIDAATVLHDKNLLAEASAELAIAYALDPKPELLFAIGQVELKRGHCGLAIAFYTRFLATNPASTSGADQAIAECRKRQPAVAAKIEAKRRIASATRHHEAQKFEAARAELVVAYALDPDPQLLYAIGQVHVKLAQCDRAIPFYERFLATNKDPAVGGETTEAIEVCRRAKPVEPPPLATLPERPPPPPPRPARWYDDKLGLALLAGGIVLGGGAAVSYKVALGKLADADAATDHDDHVALVDDARGKRNLAVALGIGGVGLTGYAVVRLVMHGRHQESVAVTPRGGGAVVTFTGRF